MQSFLFNFDPVKWEANQKPALHDSWITQKDKSVKKIFETETEQNRAPNKNSQKRNSWMQSNCKEETPIFQQFNKKIKKIKKNLLKSWILLTFAGKCFSNNATLRLNQFF